MPLPEKVIQQLGQETPQTPGWSFGIMSFAGGIFLIVLLLWAGLTFGYKPYLDGQVANIQEEINKESSLISPADQTNLINYYSQIANLRTLLQQHQAVSQVFPWLEKNSEQNTFFSSLSLADGNKLTLAGGSKTESDANQQIAIFEQSPDITDFTVSGVNLVGTPGYWVFTATMSLKASVFASVNP